MLQRKRKKNKGKKEGKSERILPECKRKRKKGKERESD